MCGDPGQELVPALLCQASDYRTNIGYLADADLSIDNNIAEQETKRVAMGRKAWLFFGSDNGGERAEVLLSIVSTCKRHKVEPWAYLKDVIEQLTQNPDTDLENLLPHNWKQNKEKVGIAA